MNLINKTIVLTGASGGIGVETAKLLAKHRCHLILVGRNQLKLEKLSQEILNSSESRTTVVLADLGLAKDREKVTALAHDIDVLINLAGVNCLSMLENMREDEIDVILRSNLIDPMLLTRGFIPFLRKKPEAAILNVGSIMGSIGIAGSAVYCASKFGLRGFTESLRRELDDTKITVGFVAPRTTETSMNSDVATALNAELGNNVDAPVIVAQAIVEALQNSSGVNRYLGWPEKLFVKINAIFPKVVDNSLAKQLPVIKKYIETEH